MVVGKIDSTLRNSFFSSASQKNANVIAGTDIFL